MNETNILVKNNIINYIDIKELIIMSQNTYELTYIPHLRENTKNYEFTVDQLVHSEVELPLGWHKQVEIVRILEGEGLFTISGKSYRVRAGSFVIINPNQIHSALSYVGRPLKYQSLKFTYNYFDSSDEDDVYNRYINPLKDGSSFLPNTIITAFPIHSKMIDLFNELDSANSDTSFGSEIAIKILIYQLIYLFYKNKFVYHRHEAPKKNTSENLVKDTITYIHNHYYEDFKLDLLATMFETSKPHLCRTFKRVTNQTITEYQNNHRIKKACELLTDSNDSIVKIAFDIGYSNISYFHERFKQKTFMTPNEFRDIQKEG